MISFYFALNHIQATLNDFHITMFDASFVRDDDIRPTLS